MKDAHPREQAVGIDHYVTGTPGIEGELRDSPEDFKVREIEAFDTQPPDGDPADYPHVVVRATLRNRETNAFATELANRLGISRNRVSWAGTKDKRAVTTQLFSIQGIDPDDVPSVSGAEIEVVGRAGRAIHFGDLAGNEFAITVRNTAVDGDRLAERIRAITADLAKHGGTANSSSGGKSDESTAAADEAEPISRQVGVPNFFGQQRFGSRRPITHQVGLAILQTDFEGAVRTYVADDDDGEPAATRTARQAAGDCFDDRDFRGAIEALPKRLDYERSILHGLVEIVDGQEPTDAAYRQALERLPESLCRMFVHAAQSYAFNRIVSERLAAGLPLDRPVAGDVVCFADADSPADLKAIDPNRTQQVTEDRVETITRHCERERAFVTAPLVGTKTELATGEPGAIERAVLDEIGIAPADFALPDDWASAGTRRAILVRTECTITGDPPTFAFKLPSGSYATVLLREYLQVDPIDLG